MALASSQAGWVLAQPLLNVHVRTLNTREIARKTAAHHCANFTDKKVTLR